MTGVDVLISERRTDEELRWALSSVFKVPEAKIAVIHCVEDYLTIPDAADAVCISRMLPEGFPQQLAIDWPTHHISEQVVQQLATALKVDCLTSSNGVNPYEMMLIDSAGSQKTVCLDVVALDEREVYILGNNAAK